MRPKKEVLTLLLSPLTLLSCGDMGLEETSDASEPAEFAQLEQPLLRMLDGYGLIPSSDGIRCFNDGGNLDWPNDCYIPGLRKINYILDPGSCGGPYAADYSAAMNGAFDYVKSTLQALGWTVTKNQSHLTRGFLHVPVKCGAPFPGASPNHTGGTQIDVASDCIDTEHGDLCKFFTASSRLYRSRVEALSGFATATQARRRTRINVTFTHEMGHVAGLGHDLCGVSPLAEVMSFDSCQGGDPSSWWLAGFTDVEKEWLRVFVP